MKRRPTSRALPLALVLCLCWPAAAQRLTAQQLAPETEGPPVDVVIALDVSGTMRGLIHAARINLWQIVNDLAEAEPTPRLRVALVTFGNQWGGRRSGWVRVETDLTGDLDRVSERMSRLRSRGAFELVGRVLETALKLDWSDDPQALKLLFIAGNEAADQDPELDLGDLARQAADAGIFVSAIYCGTTGETHAATWRELAELAEGSFATIDHTAPAVLLPTPFDSQLSVLGEMLNETFVPLGSAGADEKRTRARQDKNARSLGLPVAATRAQTKASPLYWSASDLVSLYGAGQFDPAAEADDLPKQLRRLTPEDRALYLEELLELRDEIRGRIAELAAKRRQFLSAPPERPAVEDPRSFDAAVRRTIRQKAEEIGFAFPEPAEPGSE